MPRSIVKKKKKEVALFSDFAVFWLLKDVEFPDYIILDANCVLSHMLVI